jgi:acylphosphatase
MSTAAEMIRHVVIHGRVQRVGFRAFVEHVAAQHDLAGWVRNRRDGSVEALFAGEGAEVEAVIEACRRGPSAARVEHVEVRDGAPAELALRSRDRFSVLPTV